MISILFKATLIFLAARHVLISISEQSTVKRSKRYHAIGYLTRTSEYLKEIVFFRIALLCGSFPSTIFGLSFKTAVSG